MSFDFLKQFGETIGVLVTFTIFFLILKKFAWGPILQLIDDRQKKIQDGFDEVKKLQVDAKESHQRYEEKMREIEAEARAEINKAVAEGQRIASEITEKARADATDIIEKGKQSIQLEVATARKQLREEVIDLALGASERLIQEKLTDAKDRELVGSFITEIEQKNS